MRLLSFNLFNSSQYSFHFSKLLHFENEPVISFLSIKIIFKFCGAHLLLTMNF